MTPAAGPLSFFADPPFPNTGNASRHGSNSGLCHVLDRSVPYSIHHWSCQFRGQHLHRHRIFRLGKGRWSRKSQQGFSIPLRNGMLVVDFFLNSWCILMTVIKVHRYEEFLDFRQDVAWKWPFSKEPSPSSDLSSPSGFPTILVPLVNLVEPKYSGLAEKVWDSALRLQESWKRMALGQGANERAFAVALGYIVVGLLLSLYLNILTVGNVRSAGRAVRSAVRQQLLVVKVCLSLYD
jgi:hypothetical protein